MSSGEVLTLSPCQSVGVHGLVLLRQRSRMLSKVSSMLCAIEVMNGEIGHGKWPVAQNSIRPDLLSFLEALPC